MDHSPNSPEKGSRKRKRALDLVFTTNVSNFRRLVQELIGIPKPTTPFAALPFACRLDLSVHLDEHGLLYPKLQTMTGIQTSPAPSTTSRVNLSDLDRISRIGSGACGTLYKVVDRRTGNLYALKAIYGSKHDDHVRRQMETLRDLDDPNIVKCHDVFDRNGEIQVLLEYMDCESLDGTRIQDEPLLSDLSRQILSGLHYLHRHGIVHGDIKPSNLLRNTRNEVKITDFVVSRILSQAMDPCSSAGTIAYMSPERINNDSNEGKYAGDIWSFGVCVLEFYLGRLPFSVGQEGDWASLMCAICLSQAPEAPPTASREFRNFVACCLQRDPARRWTALQLLSHPFITRNTTATAGRNDQVESNVPTCKETVLKSDLLGTKDLKFESGYHPPSDEQNVFASDTKSTGKEDLGSLQLQARQFPVVMNTTGAAPEGCVFERKSLESDHDYSMRTAPKLRVFTGKRLKETPSEPRELEEFNCEAMEVSPTISHHFSILHVLDLSYTAVHSLPQSISRLVALKKLFLRSCELLMELPPEIGELTNLEVLDLEGTEVLCLPKEIAKLVNLTCLKVSFYGYANQTVIPRRVLSNLSRLIELIIDVTPYGEWWDAEAEAIIDDLCSLKELRTLKLNLPTIERLEDLIVIVSCLANFRFTVGRHEEHYIARLPCDVEEEFNNLQKQEKGLKYINGDHITNEITKVFKHATIFILQRHWTAENLCEFGYENMNEVKFCLVMECNEFRTIFDFEQFYQRRKDDGSELENFQDCDDAIVLGSLEKLIIRYMKNLASFCKGPVGVGFMYNLKSLALHTCPSLTTLFTINMLSNLINLEELIVEDCPKIDSLVSLNSSDLKSGLFLPCLKKLSLLELPELVNICSGLRIAPKLERMVIFYCPKLEMLSTMDVSSTNLKVIKGEKEWWNTLKWYESDLSMDCEDNLARLFIPLRRDGDLMAQLTED